MYIRAGILVQTPFASAFGCLLEDVVFVSRPSYKAFLFELPQDRGRRACVTSEFEVSVKCQTSIWFLRGCVYWL